ncbi:hypothetical protein ACGF0J_11780 [Nonomuraea sp. NPDC047897]|uniref:hypothetical protein n=1 Tax=Nonomuraea sp. NPDC047897 TaxID=3364346 RepID=UPI00371722D4
MGTGSRFHHPTTNGTYGSARRDLEQWEFEVTSGGRIRYAIDDATRTVWVIYASPRHPKDTD